MSPTTAIPPTTAATTKDSARPATAAGGFHSLVFCTDGTVWVFGHNVKGQLGTTANNDTGVPNPTPATTTGAGR